MRTKNLIFVVLALTWLNSAVMAQQKYALLIAGDYKPATEIPDNHKWNNGQAMDPQKGWDEFWNDTYLMWELLYDDPISKYTNENIQVLFAGGVDYTITFPNYYERYRSIEQFEEIDHITDNYATKANVISALDELANIEEEDYLFIWIMSNGGNTGNSSYVYLWGYDPVNPNAGRLYDTELKAKLDLIPAHKKVVVVQAPNSGGFATNLADDNIIVITSSQTSQQSSRANDTPYEENEWWGGVQYHHGEFGYHLYSPLNGEDPGLGISYGTTSFSTANTFNDDVISMEEGINWLNNNLNTTEIPVVSDPNNMSEITAVQYSTLIFGEIYSDVTFQGTLGLTGLPPVPGQPTTAIVHWNGDLVFSKSNLFFLDDTRFYKDIYNSDLLMVDDNVSLYGTSGASGLISYSAIEFGFDVLFSGINGERWGGLVVQNSELLLNRTTFIDCYAILNTIPVLTITDCEFTRAGLIGQFLYQQTHIDHNTYFINSYADLTGSRGAKILVEDCHFSGPNFDNNYFGLQIKNFTDYSVMNSIIQDYGYGLYIDYCSGAPNKRDISNNSIHNNNLVGIWLNRSYAHIFDNPGIYNNYIGIQCTNYSNVSIDGNEDAHHVSETQRIYDNDLNQIRASAYSFPYLKWNAIWKDYNVAPLIYYDLTPEPALKDIKNNFWGAPEFFNPNQDFYPSYAFMWLPVWDLAYGPPPKGEDELLYEDATQNIIEGNFSIAKNEYMQVISNYPESPFAESALKELLPLEREVANDYTSLQQYYLSDTNILNNPYLNDLAFNLANWCNVENGNYLSAIENYNAIIQEPPSYHDSIFAIFDLNLIYDLLNNGYKSASDNYLRVFDLTPKKQQDDFIDYYGELLFPQRNLSDQMKHKIESLGAGKLIQNFPNPFNNQTEIWFKLDRPAQVTLNFYDYTGKEVSVINPGTLKTGNHSVQFNSANLPSGIYFYSLEVNGIKTDTKKMTMMK